MIDDQDIKVFLTTDCSVELFDVNSQSNAD